jgi:hypothetical protein
MGILLLPSDLVSTPTERRHDQTDFNVFIERVTEIILKRE